MVRSFIIMINLMNNIKNMDRQVFIDYKMLKISWEDLKRFSGNPYKNKIDFPIIIDVLDILNVIELFEKKKIDVDELMHWADIIRFSEIYDYPDELNKQEKIAMAIDMIQDISLFNLIPDYKYITKIKQILIE